MITNNKDEEDVKYFKENKYDFLIEKLNMKKAILNTMNDDLKNINNSKENKLTNLNIVNFSLNWNILLCEFMKIKIKINNNNNYPKRKIKNNIKERKGDWVCQFCCNINFAFRTVCNRCKGKKEVCLQKIIM